MLVVVYSSPFMIGVSDPTFSMEYNTLIIVEERPLQDHLFETYQLPKIFQKVRKCSFRKLTYSVNIRRKKDNVKRLFRH